MRRFLVGTTAMMLAVGLVMLALYLWQSGGVWAQQARQPVAAERSVRLAGVASITLAQATLAFGSIPMFFRPGKAEAIYGVVNGLFAVISGVAAGLLAASAW